MNANNEEFLRRLRATFRIEAEEHCRAISAGLVEVEKTADVARRAEIIETIFREAHSLKGAARSVNLKDIESICQPLEGAFAALKRREMSFSPVLFDLFHQAVDTIDQLVLSIDTSQKPKSQPQVRELIRQLGNISNGTLQPERLEERRTITEARNHKAEAVPPSSKEVQVSPHVPLSEKSIAVETVRIPTSRLDSLLLQAEEMIQTKIAASQRVAELQEINRLLVLWNTESKKWKDRGSAEGTSQWNEVLEWTGTRLNDFESRTTALIQAAERDQRALKRMVDEHLEAMKKVLMLPVATLTEVFPKYVRDLARNQGKNVNLIIRGAEIEIDMRVLQELKDPLIHLVRNCVDHGIEKPEERARKHKPPLGTITLAFSAKDSRQFEILVSDDGAGIDLNRVQAAAMKMGIVSRDAAGKLDPKEASSLIFQSGVSTSPIITDISGRGLGLAIVREKVEKLGGAVSVDSKTNIGTTLHLLLPMTLATFRGVLVRVEQQVFVLPTMNVERTLRVNLEEIKTVENRETIRLDGEILSLVRLNDALGLPARSSKLSTMRVDPPARVHYFPVVVLTHADKRIAFQVDEILDEQQVLVKELGKQLSRVRNIAGATVLGTGKAVPVMNVSDLMKSTVQAGAGMRAEVDEEKVPSKVGKILVVEDSITSRTLIKNILETAGYQVATAVDGADAFTQVMIGGFDLVVSDVDMPRMNGFELTAKIRDDKKLSEMPVVLVTALESRDDRERGIEVGADAYIIKSSFDQSNLLEVIRKFI